MVKIRYKSYLLKKSAVILAVVCMAIASVGCGSVDLRMYESNSSAEESTSSVSSHPTESETKAPGTAGGDLRR